MAFSYREKETLKKLKQKKQHLKIYTSFLEREIGQKKTVKEVKRADFQIIFHLGGKEKKSLGAFSV